MHQAFHAESLAFIRWIFLKKQIAFFSKSIASGAIGWVTISMRVGIPSGPTFLRLLLFLTLASVLGKMIRFPIGRDLGGFLCEFSSN